MPDYDDFIALHEQVMPLAMTAMKTFTENDDEAFDNAMCEIINLDGVNALAVTIMAWVDRTARQCGWNVTEMRTASEQGGAALQFLSDTPDPQILDPDQVSPDQLWASRVTMARLVGDRDNFCALIETLDENTIGWVHTLLAALVDTIAESAAQRRDA